MTCPGTGEIRPEHVPDPGPGDVVVRTLHSGVSRGTETLVFQGRVPESQWAAMRAPFQEGDFPAPVKYGYLNVGVVEAGVPELIGKTVFCLYPHQTRYVVPADAVTVIPDDVPAARAVLAGTVETAVNAVWDAAPQIGDRITVIGGGMVGASVAAVLAGLPATDVELVDIDPNRENLTKSLDIRFAQPATARADRDLIIHASATEAGLDKGLELLRTEGTLVELSWFGDRRISVPLGENFHSRRLTIRSSQVGGISPTRHRGYAERFQVALELLKDPRFDALITGHSPFEELPAVLPRLADGTLKALCHVIDHPDDHPDDHPI
ncbi:zinc-dependent alcohol dehydrogenase [Actinoplanes subglobosus]|uniref:Zinc-binding alcohol dehydrogenase n=1 Tax=Actinoplanes subglobosus TaxID=1547892 RepID=A0ABV8J6J2_9ACTN